MVSSTALLQSGIAAAKNGYYDDAISHLEKFCRYYSTSPGKEYVQAQIWLVKVYQETGQVDQAIALAHRLTCSKEIPIQQLGQKILQALSAAQAQAEKALVSEIDETDDTVDPIPLSAPRQLDEFDRMDTAAQGDDTVLQTDDTVLQGASRTTGNVACDRVLSELEFQLQTQDLSNEKDASEIDALEAEDLLDRGIRALRFGRYAQAANNLEQFCQKVSTWHKHYAAAQKALVKAYAGAGKTENARVLCQKLTTSRQEIIRIWARKYLMTLAEEEKVGSSLRSNKKTVWSARVSNLSGARSDRATQVIRSRRFRRRLLAVGCHGAAICSIALVPLLLPLGILFLVKDNVIRRNAKESLNLYIWLWTWWIAIGLTALIGHTLIPGAKFLAIFPTLAIALALLGVILAIMALAHCWKKPSKPYFYPIAWRLL